MLNNCLPVEHINALQIRTGRPAGSAEMIIRCSRILEYCDVRSSLDQDDFWFNQPKIINLIASKVLEQLYGFD